MTSFETYTIYSQGGYLMQILVLYTRLLTALLRRMDILNADLSVLNEVEKSRRAEKAPKRKGAKNKPKDEESGFHFIAYVPIDNTVWRLDGLQRQPVKLGKFSSTYK